MSFGTPDIPTPAPDPALLAQQQQAKLAQQQAVQQGTSADTWNMLRIFGAQNAMSGAGLTAPLTGMVGAKR
jgi:hypothetical protein